MSTYYTREAKLVTDELCRLRQLPADRFPHSVPPGYPCGVCGQPILAGEKYQCNYGTGPRETAEDARSDWFHSDHDRFGWDGRHRDALTEIFRKGGLVALGTEESRLAWFDGIPELVSEAMRHFTPEEIETITKGTE